MPALVVSAAGVEALERLKEPVDLVGRDDCSAVGYREDRRVVGGIGRDVNVPAGDVVADGVGDEVGYEAFEESGVAVERGGTDDGLDLQVEVLGVVVSARQDSSADLGQIGLLSMIKAALAG